MRSALTRAVAALGTALLVLTGCGTVPNATSGEDRPFTINWSTQLTNIDPAFVCAGDDNSFASNFYARLVALDTDTQEDGTVVASTSPDRIQPDLAESWTVSEDGTNYTFKLREGAKFANGNPLDAEAVRYSIMRNLTIGACGALALQIGLTDPPLIKGVVVVDPATVRLELSRAYPSILVTLAQSRGSIYDPVEIKAHGEDKKGVPNQWLASHTASSSGPYVLDTYVPNNHAILTRNPNYHGKPALEETVRINFITSVPTLMLQARRGQADVTLGLPPYVVDQLRSEDCCKVATAPSLSPATVSMNNQEGNSSNAKLREALTHAVPYDQIIEEVAHGFADSYYGPFPPDVPGFNKELSAPRTMDKELARRLVAESGIENPTIDLMINPAAPSVSTLAIILKAGWEEIGVKVNIDSQTPTSFATRFNTGKYGSAFLFEGAGSVAAYELRKKMTCGSSFNNQHICIDGTAELLEGLGQIPDLKDQQPVIDALTEKWLENSSTIVLYRARFTAVLARDVNHFKYSSSLRFSEWGN